MASVGVQKVFNIDEMSFEALGGCPVTSTHRERKKVIRNHVLQIYAQEVSHGFLFKGTLNEL